jgi:hypothetical protein
MQKRELSVITARRTVTLPEIALRESARETLSVTTAMRLGISPEHAPTKRSNRNSD